MPHQKIISEWKSGRFKPVYWLEGDEPYFIDKVVDYAEHHILNESEAGFNLNVLYGRDVDWATVINTCRRYPMFGDKQVVIIKEAQNMRDIEKLEAYVTNPLTSTVLVVAYKDNTLDKRKTFSKTIAKFGELFQSKKIYDNELPEWISNMVQAQGVKITSGAINLLVDNIGNDLNRLENEVEKVRINLSEKQAIDENAIEQYVGISKEFNSFEMQSAISRKDMAKAIRIIQYFEGNPKAAPIQMLLPILYAYFSKVYSTFSMPNKTYQGLRSLFPRFNTYEDAVAAAKHYDVDGIQKILLLLHDYNLRSIGINSTGTSDADLMKEMVVKMMS